MANQPDFDTLRRLSESDPAAFFAERARLIEDFFASVPPERAQALRKFQSEIDAVRASAGTPAYAVESLMGMISDHLQALFGYTAHLTVETRRLRAAVQMLRSGSVPQWRQG